MHESLLAHADQFRACVLLHIRNDLPQEEWVWLREQAEAQINGFQPIDPEDIEASPEALVEKYVHAIELRTVDLLKVFPGHVVGEVAGEPVHYCPKTGIYLWSKSAECLGALSFWITHPAYPPGW